MPAPTTSEEFLELVRKSGVVEADRLQTYLERLRESRTLPPSPEGVAQLLVQDGIITYFQAEQFRAGRWRRFTIGKYKVLERLGAGGMGTVYLCEHMLMKRQVAVKVLPPNKVNDSSSLERFYREAKAVAALDHPNIVRAYDIGEDDKLHFIVMEHVDGANLQEIIKKTGPMDPLRVAHYMRQSALGLQHAHETVGLVHRDIKPGNILVDRHGVVKILDMGLARFFHDDTDDLTKKYDENVLGTADYLAPEQALDSHAADIRADIYSLGGTFYFCLTGRTPFTEGTVAQKLIWHQTRQPKPIRSIRPEVPQELAAIIEKAMAKDKNERYQTPQELADELEPWTTIPIPPPPEEEMPQFSLAARASKSLSDTGMSSSAASSSRSQMETSPIPVRRPWPAATQSSTGSGRTSSASAKPAAVSPLPRPAGPPRSTPPQTPLPPVAPPEALPVAAAPPELFIPRSVKQVTQNLLRYDRKSLLRWLLLAAGVLVPVTMLLLWQLLSTDGSNKSNPSKPAEPILVGNGTSLASVLRRINDGDKIWLTGDITEANLSLTSKKNITIEAEPGKEITWRFPAEAPAETKLIILSSCPGFQLRGITLDGATKAESLVVLYGKSPGATLEKLQLRNFTKNGIVVSNSEGSVEAPITFSELTIKTAAAGQVGVRFEAPAHSALAAKKNANFVLRRCSFSGPGTSLGSSQPEITVDLASMQLPGNIKIERVP